MRGIIKCDQPSWAVQSRVQVSGFSAQGTRCRVQGARLRIRTQTLTPQVKQTELATLLAGAGNSRFVWWDYYSLFAGFL